MIMRTVKDTNVQIKIQTCAQGLNHVINTVCNKTAVQHLGLPHQGSCRKGTVQSAVTIK